MKEFSDEAFRVSANLEQAYDALRETAATVLSKPNYMTWRTVSGHKYLYQSIGDRKDKSLGRESDETLKIYNDFHAEKKYLDERLTSLNQKFTQTAALYRALRLPQVMTMPAKILFEMDIRGLLDESFIVVGSSAFPAYEIEAGGKFMDGLDETEDFDLSWRPSAAGGQFAWQNPAIIPRTGEISLSAIDVSSSQQDEEKIQHSLFDVATEVDKTFETSMFSGHKLRNKDAFEIDVLCRSGDHFKSEVKIRNKIFGDRLTPLELEGQDILHLGQKLRHIVIGRTGSPAPLMVPDPRCMAIHKHWLSQRPDRTPQKRRKDGRQAEALWNACHQYMPRFPIDDEFIASLPEKWAKVAQGMLQSIPQDTSSPGLRPSL